VLFPTVDFAIFFLVVFAIAWAIHRHGAPHRLFLLAASYFFYGFWDLTFLPLLIGISLKATLIAAAIQKAPTPQRRKRLLALGVTLSLATLAFFKYTGFLASALVDLLHLVGVPFAPRLPEIALPIGVSFFVFHAISLMVDAYRDEIPVRVRVLDGLLYVAIFPQLVAGPILRASTFLPQLLSPPNPAAIDATRALQLIALGLAKKVLVANYLSTHLVDAVFQGPEGRSAAEVLIATYAYAAQIYCDFSGYTDIAIGCALLLGYRFPQNFNAPYVATNLQDFWRRWHISLSTWLRDYLYIPLGGSRQGPTRTQVNLFITMVLGGLWHGASWNFVIWGALHGLGLALHRVWTQVPLGRIRHHPLTRAASLLLTFHFVCVGWIFFRAQTFDDALHILSAFTAPWTLGPWLTPTLIIALAAGLLAQFIPKAAHEATARALSRLPAPAQGAIFALAVLLIDALGPSGVAPFIYFQF
jgi:D-alanyl-lipoteichoic acid acyltransferase DltB (MBOAT superfamily)